MNATQIESAIGSIIIALGGFFIGKGWATTDQVAAFATAISTLIGALFVIVPFVRKLYTASTTAKIAQINATPGVKVVAQSVPAPAVTAAP